MSHCQPENTISNRRSNRHWQSLVSHEAKPEQSNTAKAQEKDLKTNFMEMIEFLKEDLKKE